MNTAVKIVAAAIAIGTVACKTDKTNNSIVGKWAVIEEKRADTIDDGKEIINSDFPAFESGKRSLAAECPECIIVSETKKGDKDYVPQTIEIQEENGSYLKIVEDEAEAIVYVSEKDVFIGRRDSIFYNKETDELITKNRFGAIGRIKAVRQ